MLGQDLTVLFGQNGYEVLEADIHNMDITDKEAVNRFFAENPCDLVIHAAAYTNVDGAETDKETAFAVNGRGSENLAVASAKLDIPIVYISTDYVFDGKKNAPYLPDDKTAPLNIYGESKLAGEIAVKKHNPKHYICRTSWLYGHKGKNFVETMITLGQTKPELRVVNDQFGCPTWTVDLSNAILKIVDMPYGVYHTCGGGQTTWCGFAKKILELCNIDTPVYPVSTDEFPRPAQRPAFSVMDNGGLLRNWEEALKEYLEARKKEY